MMTISETKMLKSVTGALGLMEATQGGKAACHFRALLILTTALTVFGFGISAKAEIMCTELGGCWETGKQIRLVNSRQETSVPNRDGKGTQRIIGVANDVPHQQPAIAKARGK